MTNQSKTTDELINGLLIEAEHFEERAQSMHHDSFQKIADNSREIADRLAQQEKEIERLKQEKQDFLNGIGRSLSRANDLMDKSREELLKKYPYLQPTTEAK